MLITENRLKQIVAEEYKEMKKEGRRSFSKPVRRDEGQEAEDEIFRSIEQNLPKYYEKRKEALEAKGKKIKAYEEVAGMINKEANEWLSSFIRGMGRGTEDDRNLSTASRIMQMPVTLHLVLTMPGGYKPYISNWDVTNNQYRGSED